MKTEAQIYEEFNRLKRYIAGLEGAIEVSKGYGEIKIYSDEIEKAERDIKKLIWVLED